jgi:hypothetical protein
MALRLMDGSEAIAEAAIAAGMKFYAGYPMAVPGDASPGPRAPAPPS